ncbi:Putative metal-binding protein [Dokdonella koreensis DS-123]|uniref:Large ribosomal RNA subunit accumulation protein YceD n=1 Tax=Dokdonella koreensis DS-123 TaxID=1300342 RepID=A0A167GZS6_9GAMM|nr:YceD family protein [Dokdonella koreensis]ANB18296.1 Putative metal-binding protein [Dokdonella koreensis DS-123]
MSAALPESVDAWRMVQGQRAFQGRLPLSGLQRLSGSLADTVGDVVYDLEFGRDAFGIAFLRLHVDAGLPLICQRTLERFVQPVTIDQRLGLIGKEQDEAGLPEGYEPLLIADGQLAPADVIEDELILTLPVVPVSPGAPLEFTTGIEEPAEAEEARENPFAVLARLRQD